MASIQIFPVADAGNFGGWSPSPLWQQLDDESNASEVACVETTNFAALAVQLSSFARPSHNTGWRVKCSARVISGNFNSADVIVSIYWNGTEIASQQQTLSSFGTHTYCGFELTASQVANIGNTATIPIELNFSKITSTSCSIAIGYLILEYDELEQVVNVNGIPSGETVGSLNAGRVVSLSGIISAETFGQTLFQGPQELPAIGGIVSSESFGTPLFDARPVDALGDLLADPDQEIQKLLVARVGLPDSDEEVLVVLSTHGYATLGDGASLPYGIPDHHLFPVGLVSAHNVKLSLLQGGGFASSALEAYGNIAVGWTDGELDDLATYVWEHRAIEVWAGPYRWIGPSFAKFSRVFQGTVESVDWDINRFTIRARDLKHLLDTEINEEAYLGYGTALEYTAVGAKVTIASSATVQPAQLLMEFMIDVSSLHNGILASKGGDAGYVLKVNSDGSCSFFDRGLTNDLHTEAGLVAAGRPTRVSFRGDLQGLKIYVNGRLAASNAVPYGGPTNSSALILGARS